MIEFTIYPEDVKKYSIEIKVEGDWVSFRHHDYSPYSASKKAGRYNHDGDTPYYLGSEYDVAKAEVPNWEDMNPYKVEPATIHAFNVAQWSQNNGTYDEFLKSKEQGGHGFCQKITDQLTGMYGVSAILYNSQPMYESGKTGCCLVVLPLSGQLIGETFFAKDNEFKG